MHRRTTIAAACLAALVGPVAGPAGATGERAPAPKRADLAVTSLKGAPSQAAPGAKITAQVAVANRGSARGAATPLRLVLSRDTRASKDDLVAGGTRAPALSPGARATRLVAGTIPAAATGRYRVIVCLAPKKPPKDKAERRNDCEIGPALTVSSLAPPPSLPWTSAQVTGEISLRQSGQTQVGIREHIWDRWGDVVVNLSVAAPTQEPAAAQFADAGSSYTWSGADHITDRTTECIWAQQTTEEGKGSLAGGRVTARFLPGTGQQTLEVALTMPYQLDGWSGACREDHTWTESHANTTVLLFDYKGTGTDDVAHYVAPVTPPAGSIWNEVSANVDLRFVRRPI